MYSSQNTPRMLARAISLALGVVALPASAVDYTWTAYDGDWDTVANWSPYGSPQTGDTATLAAAGFVTYNTASPYYLSSVSVDDGTQLQIMGSYLNAGSLVAGMTGWSGGFQQFGGYVHATELLLGANAGTDGLYRWMGGTLDIDRISVGTAGTGTFVQDSGAALSLAPHQTLVIGEQTGSTGVFEQHSGNLDAYSSQIVVGAAGHGTYRQWGGTHSASETIIGQSAGSEGSYESEVAAVLHSTDRTVVGDAGVGHYAQRGGLHYTGELIVGRAAGSSGDYLLDAYPGLHANTLVLGQDAGSQGTFTYRYGNLDVGRISVGQNGSGTFIQESGYDLNFDEYRQIVIGEFAGSEGLYEQRIGNVHNTGEFIVGDAGRGTYRHLNGLHRTDTTMLGRYAGSEGVYELQELSAYHSTTNTVVGFEGTGRYVHAAGLHSSQQIDIGPLGTGHYEFSGGHLDARNVNISNGDFTWTGGELNVDTLRVGYQSGGPGRSGAFVQDIGSGNTRYLTPGQSILIGGLGSDGVYEQRSGNIDARDSQIIIGDGGDGTYRHIDGMHQATETVIGRGGQYPEWGGTYELIGGSALHAAQRTVVGDTGTGRFVQTAGFNDSQELIVGRTDRGEGEYLLSGGALYAQSIVLGDTATYDGRFNRRSGGSFVWTGGTLNFDQLRVGRAGSGGFIQDVGEHNGLSLAPHQSLVIAEQAGSQGVFEQRSGNVDSRYSPIVIGEGGTGSYWQMAGQHQATETILGRFSGSEGFYTLSGASGHITQRTVVGDAGYGAYYQSAGFHDTQELVIAQTAGSYGYYDLYGGNLNTSTTRIATTSGATGAMRVHGPNAYWHNSGTIYVGAENSPATATPGTGWVELSDGSRISATAVIVAETGALKGRGVIEADVVNAGAFDPGLSGAGQLDIFGQYTQLAEGDLFIQIGGHAAGFNSDMVNIFGDANLAGSLSVNLLGGYQFNLGDSFEILYANMVYGSFDSLLFPIFDGMTFDIAYDLNTVRLTVVSAVPVPAAAWLFGSGVVAMMGIARRRKAA